MGHIRHTEFLFTHTIEHIRRMKYFKKKATLKKTGLEERPEQANKRIEAVVEVDTRSQKWGKEGSAIRINKNLPFESS